MSVASVLHGELPEAEHRSQLRKAVIASTIGTTIEWYDFFLYSTVTGLVFAQLFFPNADPLVGALNAFAIYAVGFVARPIGAAIFGHYGDRIGRKSALIATLLIMGIATFLVALVPGYTRSASGAPSSSRCCASSRGSASAANGAARCCWRWSGRAPTSIAATSRRGRSSACRPASFSPTSRCSRSARCRATVSRLGLAHSVPAERCAGRRRPLHSHRHPRDAGVRRLVAEKRIERAPVLEVIRRQPADHADGVRRMAEQAPFYI